MSTTRSRVCLFGGALFAAGIAAPAALAQGLAHGYSIGVISADRITGTDPYFQPITEAVLGFGNTTYGAADLFCAIVATTSEVSFVHNRPSSGTFSYSYAGVNAFAYAIADTAVLLSWDLGAWEEASFAVLNHTDVTVVFDAGGIGAGETTLALDDGKLYQFVMLTKGEAAGGNSFARVEVAEPCPGDVDGNGMINLDDIEAFVDAFLAGCP